MMHARNELALMMQCSHQKSTSLHISLENQRDLT